MKKYIDNAGVFVLGQASSTKEEVSKLADYIEVFMSDWTEAYRGSVTTIPAGRKIVVKFSDDKGEEVMSVALLGSA